MLVLLLFVLSIFRAFFPIAQSFSTAGDFTFGKKLLQAAKENAIFYGIVGVCFALFFIIALVSGLIGFIFRILLYFVVFALEKLFRIGLVWPCRVPTLGAFSFSFA
jgi:hypothetical protein